MPSVNLPPDPSEWGIHDWYKRFRDGGLPPEYVANMLNLNRGPGPGLARLAEEGYRQAKATN